MILRFIVENLASFKDAVEFNTFPSSKSHRHENHKITCGYVTALRMSAIYGANGAGKSNLFSALGLLGTMVLNDGLEAVTIHGELPFKFDESCINKPSGLAVEFYYNQRIYYYHIEFNRERIFLEELYLSGKTKDIKLFVRQDSSIEWNGDYFAKGFIQQFVDGLERLVRPDMMVLPFMGKYYPDEMPLVSEAYSWFVDKLEVIQPGTLMHIIPQMFDSNVRFSELVNSLIPELKTGISRLTVRKEELKEENVNVTIVCPGGMPTTQEMINSIEKIKKYDDAVIYPGHGDKTTLNYEKNNNVYFVLIHDAYVTRNNRYLTGKIVENGKG